MKLTIAALLSLLSAQAAHADQWRLAAQQIDHHPMSRMYIDAGNVRTTGTVITIRVMTVLEPRAGMDWSKSIVDRDIDCAAMKSRMMVTRFYAIDGHLLEQDSDPGEWKQANPGTMLEGVALTACGRADYLGTAAADAEGEARVYFRSH